jgi:hypothetical protein
MADVLQRLEQCPHVYGDHLCFGGGHWSHSGLTSQGTFVFIGTFYK